MTAITHFCEYGWITPVRVDTRVLGVPGLLRGVRHRYAPVSFPEGTELLFLSLQFPHAHLNLRPSRPSLSLGANDVSNAFATSVGSGAINLKSAVAIAAVCEFSGAVLMGGSVAETIRKGIADLSEFEGEPEVLMYGMMCVLLTVAMWLLVATQMSLPVSTTHTTVGGVIGMSMVARGASSVAWGKDMDPTFPWFTGVSKIVASWIFSPILSAIAAAGLFVLIRGTVLRTKQPVRNSLIAFPIVVGATISLNIYLLLIKGTSARAGTDEWPLGVIMGTTFGVGSGAMILVAMAMPFLLSRIDTLTSQDSDKDLQAMEAAKKETGKKQQEEDELSDVPHDPERAWAGLDDGDVDLELESTTTASIDRRNWPVDWAKRYNASLAINTAEVVSRSNAKVQEIHENAEVFDPKAEKVFGYMQVFSACCDSFAHGANDVSNAMGPFAAIYGIYRSGLAQQESSVPLWILATGGFGMVVGLALLGSKIIKQIGMRLSKITPARGLCIELGAALVVIVGTKFGIPLSTTHCQVGATTGVAMLEGNSGVNWMLFLQVIMGWMVTLVIAAMGASAFTAQGLYAPHIHRDGMEEGFALGAASCNAP